MNGKESHGDGTNHPTSDNSYSTYSGHRYTPVEAGKWIGITSRRVRQLSSKHAIGSKLGEKYWTYTLDEITLLNALHRESRAKSMMKDVTPRDPLTATQIIENQEVIAQYIRAQFVRLRQDAFMLVGDVSTGLHNRLSKSESRFERQIYNIEETVKELRRELERRKKEEERGRGVSILGRTAPLTLTTYGAEAA